MTTSSFVCSWQVLVVICIVCYLIWGIAVKIAAAYLNAPTMSFIGISTSLIFVIGFSASHFEFKPIPPLILSAVGGIFGGIASLALYAALRQAPVGVILPLTEQYIVFIPLFSWLLLGEEPGIRQIVGILFSAVAILLLLTCLPNRQE